MVDIVVLGATGYTGRLIVNYLYHHPERLSFTLAIAARSEAKLAKLKETLGLDHSVQVFVFNIDNQNQVEDIVAQSQVVINAIGPYTRYSSGVVGACVRQGKHYVDLSSETHWIKDIIFHYDYLATKTHSIVVPSSGFESVPSDICVYLSNLLIKKTLGPDTHLENSITAIQKRGGHSGGTLRTYISAFEDVPRRVWKVSRKDYALSTIKGVSSHKKKLFYKLPFTVPTLVGCYSPSGISNRAIVQRTWSFNEYMVRQSDHELKNEERHHAYGPRFKYEEFLVTRGRIAGLLLTLLMSLIAFVLSFALFRWLFKLIIPAYGGGPSQKQLEKGFVAFTNITTSVPTPSKPLLNVRTTVKAQGNPYAVAAIIISESALAILLNHPELPTLGQQGGILTPVTGLGEVLVKRLEKTGKVEFGSEVVE